jgi:hypothetical protein
MILSIAIAARIKAQIESIKEFGNKSWVTTLHCFMLRSSALVKKK